MKRVIVACLLMVGTGSAVGAEEFATKKDAEAIVKKAVAHVKSAGKDAAYKSFTDKGAGWVDKDLYVVSYDLNGVVLAHGQNAGMVGKNLIELKDPDGKAFIKERVDLAKTKGKFWQDYKFTDPVTKKVLPKEMYCEKLDESVVCAGVYKR